MIENDKPPSKDGPASTSEPSEEDQPASVEQSPQEEMPSVEESVAKDEPVETTVEESTTATDEAAEANSQPARRVETSVGASDQEEAQAVGSELQAARESRGMTIPEIAQQLKLLPEIITALEQGDTEAIGQSSSIYIEGYYRAYARLVDVDVGQTRFAVDRARPQILEPIAKGSFNYQAMDVTPMSDRPRDKSDGIIYALVVVMVIIVGGIIWWVWPTADEMLRTDTGVVVAPVEASTDPIDEEELPYYLQDDPVPPDTAPPGEDNSGVVDATSDEALPNDAGANASEQQDINDASTPESSGRNESNLTRETAATEFENVVPGAEARTGVDGPTGTLVLSFSGDSWVEVYGANEERLYYKMGQLGEVTSLVGLLPVRVLIGDASVVSLRFNDAEVDLEPFTAGSVANVTLE